MTGAVAPDIIPPYDPPGPPPALAKPSPAPQAPPKLSVFIGEWPDWWDDPIPPHEKEDQYRRQEFDAQGNWIKLADDQEWCFPRPRVVAGVDTDQEYGFGFRFWYGAKFKRLMEEYAAVGEELGDEDAGQETRKKVVAYHFWIARFMLGINYDMPVEKAAELLLFAYDRDDMDPAIEQILQTAGGWDGPKRPPAGDASPG